MNNFSVGTIIGGYEVTRSLPLSNLDGIYLELVHSSTGARHIHVSVQDENNVFCVAFPTHPFDSTGVAHILEHTVLRGSERFPVSDPHGGMRSRSLVTFLNAMTFPDSTTYPFSTRVAKDYYNLLQHYLSAAFFPLLEELAFRQEGHRLEFESPDDPSTPLRFKGVVFNEMKGQMSTASYNLIRALGRAVYPDLTYAQNSGGDPAEIPNLTYEGLKEFHASHYHPGNAYFYTYGNLPLDNTLQEIESQVLARFDTKAAGVRLGFQTNFDGPGEFRASYPISEEEPPERKAHVLVAWKTVPQEDPYQLFCLSVLGEILLGNPGAPLRKALIDSGLGEALADFSGVGGFYREASFAAGLKNTDASSAVEIEELILSTLGRLAQDGIDPEMIDAAVHQFEISSREVSNAGTPFGLRLFLRLRPSFLNGGDPYRALQFDEDFDTLARDRKEGGFFEGLIRRLLLENSHRVRIVLRPDRGFTAKRDEAEAARLVKTRETLSESDVARIVEVAASLKERQDRQEDLSILPRLTLADIPMNFEDVEHSVSTYQTAAIAAFPQPTNGFTYFNLAVSFESLPDRLLDVLPLFTYAASRVGAAGLDYTAMAARIERYTGGVSMSARIKNLAGAGRFVRRVALTGKALSRYNDRFFPILGDLATSLEFDPKRVGELIAERKANKESQLLLSGHIYAIYLSASKVSSAAALAERLHGLTELTFLKALKDDDLEGVVAGLREIGGLVFQDAIREVCVTAEPDRIDEVGRLVEGLLSSLPQGNELDPVAPHSLKSVNEARTLSVQVAYNSKTFKVVDMTHADGAALHVLCTLLGSKFLIPEIRKKGGAYGAFAVYDREGATLSFATYRDPQIRRSFETFDRAVEFPSSERVTPEWIEEAILEACRAVDPLLSPDTKGAVRFYDDLAGFTLDVKTDYKKRLLNVTRDDLVRVAGEYLSSEAALATIASPEKVEEANAEMGGIFEVSAV